MYTVDVVIVRQSLILGCKLTALPTINKRAACSSNSGMQTDLTYIHMYVHMYNKQAVDVVIVRQSLILGCKLTALPTINKRDPQIRAARARLPADDGDIQYQLAAGTRKD
ncbi:uncharacterized protein LOC110180239 [Drosophila serrata]|uniref:uncharacterized protein LOC110180239 n=1 Tax=Drosophila serrata TaxID=7274 RepID=UPI000A1D1C97|nr:uncharacterized protein LOC110180239 [Drosophila serrata]